LKPAKGGQASQGREIRFFKRRSKKEKVQNDSGGSEGGKKEKKKTQPTEKKKVGSKDGSLKGGRGFKRVKNFQGLCKYKKKGKERFREEADVREGNSGAHKKKKRDYFSQEGLGKGKSKENSIFNRDKKQETGLDSTAQAHQHTPTSFRKGHLE